MNSDMFPPSCKSQTDEIMAKKLIWPPVEKTDPNYKVISILKHGKYYFSKKSILSSD